MSLWRTVQVVTTEDTLHATALGIIGNSCYSTVCCSCSVQFHCSVSANICSYISCSPTAAVCIMGDGTAGQLHISVLLDSTQFAAAIDVAGNTGAIGRSCIRKDVHQCTCRDSKVVGIDVSIFHTTTGTIDIAAIV